MKRAIAGIALALAAGLAHGEGVGGGLSIGTLGAGIQLVYALDARANLRVGVSGWDITHDLEVDGVDYRAKVKIGAVPLFVDWFPVAGGIFRLTGGIVANSNKLNLEARARSGVFDIGNTSYGANEIGAITGSVKYDAVAPYFGVGWGNAVARGATWSWNVDLGLMYQGSPRTTYSVFCGAAISAARCAQLQADAVLEADEFDRELRRYRFYPLAQFWVGRQF